jgi:hypothetical protein
MAALTDALLFRHGGQKVGFREPARQRFSAIFYGASPDRK